MALEKFIWRDVNNPDICSVGTEYYLSDGRCILHTLFTMSVEGLYDLFGHEFEDEVKRLEGTDRLAFSLTAKVKEYDE